MKIVYTFGKPRKWYHIIPAIFIHDIGYYMPDDYVLLSVKLKKNDT